MQFQTVNDDTVEGDEVVTFIALARNSRDVFINAEDFFTVVITNDDGKKNNLFSLPPSPPSFPPSLSLLSLLSKV